MGCYGSWEGLDRAWTMWPMRVEQDERTVQSNLWSCGFMGCVMPGVLAGLESLGCLREIIWQ